MCLQSVTSRLRIDVAGSASREHACLLLPWEGCARARETGHWSGLRRLRQVRCPAREFAMSASPAVSACLVSTDLAEVSPPSPESLVYGFTLPAEAVSSWVARATTRVVLQMHGLEEMADVAVQVVGELTACAFRLGGDGPVYLSLRWWEGELQVVLYDGHRRHVHPRLAAACDERRGDALRVLGCVVEGAGGEWGFGEAREPGGGTRMWAVLPWAGAREFAAAGVGRA